MVQKTGISNDWLAKYKSDYKNMFEYIDSKSPEELFDNLIISDEVVFEVKRLMSEALIEDYNIGDDGERSKLFKKFDYLLSVSERFEDKYDFFSFVYLFSRVMDELRFSTVFKDDKVISTPETLKALKAILSFYDEEVALKLIGLFTSAEGTLHNRIYQFSKILTDIVNNKALSTHPLTSWIHFSNYVPFSSVYFKITFDVENKTFKVAKHRDDSFGDSEITVYNNALIFRADDNYEFLCFNDEIKSDDVELVKVYAQMMEMKLSSHRFNDHFDLKPLLENLFLSGNQKVWLSEIRRHSQLIIETVVSECLKNQNKSLDNFIKEQIKFNTIPQYPELMYLFEDAD
jgi:hypothetical protein